MNITTVCPTAPTFDIFLLANNDPWCFIHTVNPYLILLLFENIPLTIIAIWVSESVEALLATIFIDNYALFLGEDGELESMTDSLVGDPLQGVIGIILLTQLFCICRHPLVKCCCSIKCQWGFCDAGVSKKCKGMAIYIPFLLSTFVSNFRVNGIKVGILINFVMMCLVFLAYGLTFRNAWTVQHVHYYGVRKDKVKWDALGSSRTEMRKTTAASVKFFRVFVFYAFVNCALHLTVAFIGFEFNYYASWYTSMFCLMFNMTALAFTLN